jgi:hypothetical protein
VGGKGGGREGGREGGGGREIRPFGDRQKIYGETTTTKIPILGVKRGAPQRREGEGERGGGKG